MSDTNSKNHHSSHAISDIDLSTIADGYLDVHTEKNSPLLIFNFDEWILSAFWLSRKRNIEL